MAAPVKRRELQREVEKNQRDDEEDSIDESSGEENDNDVADEQVSTRYAWPSATCSKARLGHVLWRG